MIQWYRHRKTSDELCIIQTPKNRSGLFKFITPNGFGEDYYRIGIIHPIELTKNYTTITQNGNHLKELEEKLILETKFK